jgi:hypothetical protein
MATGWKSDTLKVMKKDGEMVFLILKDVKNVNEIKTYDLSKIISNLEANKNKSDDDPIILLGDKTNYSLKASGDYYYISELSTGQIDRYVVRIFDNTSYKQLQKYKEDAAKKGIEIDYENLIIVNGKIDGLKMTVDCNDGFSGSFTVTEIPETGVGFIRDYSEDASTPFKIGNIFRNNEIGEFGEEISDQSNDEDSLEEDDSSWKHIFEEGFDTAFNNERNVERTKKTKYPKYDHELEFLIGLNNYLGANNQFPDNTNENYSVDPITSWTYGLNSVHKVALNPYIKLNFHGGLQWHNFAMADSRYQVVKGAEMVEFIDRNSDNPRRSKINATYLNVSFIPVFQTGKKSSSFRFGVGPYAGYRIGSKSKFKYENRGKDISRNNLYLNNWKYGIRAQIGWKGVDLFATYDISPLYIEGRGPELNTFSFGIIF